MEFAFITRALLVSLSLIALVAVLSVQLYPARAESRRDVPTEPKPGFAVVELFTSQGCSSCPPADRVLHELHRDARAMDLPVYVLSYHVDYWDRLGWKDPYGTVEATERQIAYARQFANENIYTPQAVVNGSTEFVGSDSARMRRAVNDYLKQTPAYRPEVVAILDGDQQVDVFIEAHKQPQHQGQAGLEQLRVVLVEHDLKNAVKRGENHGKVLMHVGVVREWMSFALPRDNAQPFELTLPVPGDADLDRLEVVTFVQGRGGAILGASAIPVVRP